jgi:hypothetical protein
LFGVADVFSKAGFCLWLLSTHPEEMEAEMEKEVELGMPPRTEYKVGSQ